MKHLYPYWGLLVLLGLMSMSVFAQTGESQPASETTSEASVTEEVILPTVSSVTVEPSATLSATAITPDVTLAPATLIAATSTPLPTLGATLFVPDSTVTAVVSSPTATMATSYIVGQAMYQQRRLDQQGILIEVFSADRRLLSSAITDANGIYQIATPAKEAYWLVASAERHQQVAFVVQPAVLPDKIMLPGGDLDADGCITTTDMDMLLAAMEGTTAALTTSVEATPEVAFATNDINGDGEVNIADLAILTGNIKPVCEIFVRADEITPTPTATLTITATPSIGTLATQSALPTLTAIATTPVIASEPVLAATSTPELIQPSPVPASATATPVIFIPEASATGVISTEEVKNE